MRNIQRVVENHRYDNYFNESYIFFKNVNANKQKVVEVAQENGDLKVDVVSEEVFFEKPLFGRSKSELSQHMLQRVCIFYTQFSIFKNTFQIYYIIFGINAYKQKREEIRDGLSTEDKCLMDAPKNPPILASPTKLRVHISLLSSVLYYSKLTIYFRKVIKWV